MRDSCLNRGCPPQRVRLRRDATLMLNRTCHPRIYLLLRPIPERATVTPRETRHIHAPAEEHLSDLPRAVIRGITQRAHSTVHVRAMLDKQLSDLRSPVFRCDVQRLFISPRATAEDDPVRGRAVLQEECYERDVTAAEGALERAGVAVSTVQRRGPREDCAAEVHEQRVNRVELVQMAGL